MVIIILCIDMCVPNLYVQRWTVIQTGQYNGETIVCYGLSLYYPVRKTVHSMYIHMNYIFDRSVKLSQI